MNASDQATDATAGQVHLRVADALPDDVGRSIARLPSALMTELGLVSDDVVEVVGRRTTVVRAAPLPARETSAPPRLRLESATRQNAGVGIDELGSVRAVATSPARSLVLVPLDTAAALRAPEGAGLAKALIGRPLLVGDTFAVAWPGAQLTSFELRASAPQGPVVVNEGTKVVFSEGLIAHGLSCPVSDLFGLRGRELLDHLALPEPWAATTAASLRVIEHLDDEIAACEAELRRLGAAHPYVPLLMSAPGIGWVLAYTIAAEIGEIERFASPKKFAGYTGLCPRVYQSGASDRRGPLAKNGLWAPALGARRGRRARRPSSLSSSPLPADQEAPRSPARRQGGARRGRPQAQRGDLVHAHPLPTVCPGRPRIASGRVDDPLLSWATEASSHPT